MIGRKCEYCGSSLDPGERCECRDVRVVILRADGSLEVSITDGTMQTYESIVGGPVERVPSLPTISILINDDAERMGLPRNPFLPLISETSSSSRNRGRKRPSSDLLMNTRRRSFFKFLRRRRGRYETYFFNT